MSGDVFSMTTTRRGLFGLIAGGIAAVVVGKVAEPEQPVVTSGYSSTPSSGYSVSGTTTYTVSTTSSINTMLFYPAGHFEMIIPDLKGGLDLQSHDLKRGNPRGRTM